MKKTIFFRFLLSALLLQPMLICFNQRIAKGEAPAGSIDLKLPGQFFLVDQDQDLIPDHLGFSVQVDGEITGSRLWLSGELQTLVENNWRTIAYSGCSYLWNNKPLEATLYFYGGELKRLKANGPFRLVLQARGVGLQTEVIAGFSPPYQGADFGDSDLVWCEGTLRKTSEVLQQVLDWASGQGMSLGRLEEEAFTFDRWRLDFGGSDQEPARRVWIDPRGEISWVDMKR